MRPSLDFVAIGLTSAVLLAARAPRAAAQLVFEPQLVGAATGDTYSPRLDLGDVDGDGLPDAVVFTGSDSLFYAYEVLLNDGTGALVPTSKVPVVQGFNALRLADLDGDERLDLISAHGDTVRLRRGQGDGSFGADEVIYTPSSPTVFRVEVAEVTGDDVLDLIALQDGLVALLPGLGDGNLAAPIPVADVQAQAAYSARAADLDGDGTVDLVVLARDDSLPAEPTSVAHICLANGLGGFSEVGAYDLGYHADLELHSLDADGLPELVSSSDDGVALHLSLGAGAFDAKPVVIDAAVFDTGLTAADFDGDGQLDLASVDPHDAELVLWKGAEGGAFAENLRLSGADPFGVQGEQPFSLRSMRAADMDGDGRTDLVRAAGDTFGQVLVSVFRNHTYGEDEPFLDLGHALSDPGWMSPGDSDTPGMLLATPILLADGSLSAGSQLRFRVLRHGVESDHAFLVLGFHSIYAPLRGGTLVPACNLVVGPLVLHGFHAQAELTTTVPAGLVPGFQFWLQAWFAPANEFQDVAATNAVCATAP